MDFGAAIVAGVVGTVVMTAILYMGMAMMPRQITMNLLYMLGTMMTRDKVMAYGIGTMMHGTMGIVLGLIHIAVGTLPALTRLLPVTSPRRSAARLS